MWMRIEYSDGYVRWVNLTRITDLAIDAKESTLLVADGSQDVLALSLAPDQRFSIRLIQDESAAMSLLWRDLDRAFGSEAQG
ncbi:MAG: hypothetical protein RQ897_13910 [Thermoflexus sp.]|nr:hypothetical protein [Thermoflexus sp.]MDT7949429.1 hypothetical protein [Thermoflexus sp.]